MSATLRIVVAMLPQLGRVIAELTAHLGQVRLRVDQREQDVTADRVVVHVSLERGPGQYTRRQHPFGRLVCLVQTVHTSNADADRAGDGEQAERGELLADRTVRDESA
ncbi:hypothetical protein [Cryptosporangium sp. NPDC048952]|uniref:hypothetical protein n=1 Tax=Cryptosporangium sp. NPDC048952 TaxID=3363961 RepID=UPI003721C14D